MSDDIYRKLKRPFPEKAVSWRVGATNQEKTSGIGLAYIDARDVMNRLDEVFGMNWACKYSHAEGKTICDIGCGIPVEKETTSGAHILIVNELNWVWRAGGAGDTDVEAEKGAISDAFKRAAVLWGIGRYLYELPNEWVDIIPRGRSYVLKVPPKLPEWATPLGFDKGLTPNGSIHSEARIRALQGIFEEVTGKWGKDDASKHKAYECWTKAIPDFQSNEELMFSWFLMESDIRSGIKRIQAQVAELKKESKDGTAK